MLPPVIAVVQTAGQIIRGSKQVFMVIGSIGECKSFLGKFSRFLSGGGGARKSKREVQGGMEWSTGLEACRHLGATHRGLWQTLRERDRKVKFMAVAREQQALLRATNRLRITLGFAFFLSAFRLLSELSVVVPATHPPDA